MGDMTIRRITPDTQPPRYRGEGQLGPGLILLVVAMFG
jgi:hypothetical protein